MKMRYIYLILLFLFSFAVKIDAQQGTRIIEGTIDVDYNGLGVYEFEKNIVVYSFKQLKDAEEAQKILKSKGPVGFWFDKKTPDKLGNFKIDVSGSDPTILVWCTTSEFNPQIIKSYEISHGMKVMLYAEDHTNLDPVEVKAKRIIKTGGVSNTQEKGGLLISETTIPVPYRVKSNLRIVAQPLWYDRVNFVDEESDTVFSYGKVVYSDLKEYGITQTRLMDYDNMNDTLYSINARIKNKRYSKNGISSNISLTDNRDSIIVYIVDTLSGHDPNGAHPYPFGAIVAIGDYNTILYRDTITDNGERRSPLKFLNCSFNEFFPNKVDFEERMSDERFDVPGELRLNFLVGRAEIIPNDSANRSQLDTLRKTFSDIANDPKGELSLVGVEVYGQASPEGDLQYNKKLAYSRALYAVNRISMFTGRKVDIKESTVAGWDMVADSLAADGYTAEAEAVNNIVNKYPGNINAQNPHIYNLPCYNSLIKETYLPKLRTVRYAYTVNREAVPDPRLLLERYRKDGKLSGHAQYYALLNYIADNITDKALLEEVAKSALKMTRVTEGPDAKFCKGYWPYAAGILACCYIARDTLDLELLKPFLDLELIPSRDSITGEILKDSLGEIKYEVKYIDGSKRWNDSHTRYVEYLNFPDFAANQLVMILNNNGLTEHRKTVPILETLIKDQGVKYDTLMAFSKCFRGGYVVDGDVCTDPNEATKVRDIVASTSVTNSVIVHLAADDPGRKDDDAKFLEIARRDMDSLPDNAVSDYLKAIITLRTGEREKAVAYLVESFKKDLNMMALANNDLDLMTVTRDYKLLPPALSNWKAAMTKTVESDTAENHPFTWYKKSLDELNKGDNADIDAAEKAMQQCLKDPKYITVLNVSILNDNAINNKKKLVKILKKFRNNYESAE